jgi:hydroxypyruvate isomerase
MPKFAANLTLMFNEVPFSDRFGQAARAGFRAVEFLFPYEYEPRAIAGWLRECGLENVLFNTPPGDWAAGERGIAAIPGREQEFKVGIATALAYAAELRTPKLHVMAGVCPEQASGRDCHKTYIENVRYAARELQRHGKELLIEPINSRDMPGYFLRTQDQAHAVREEVGERNVKVQMDFYHAQITGGDLTATFRKYWPHIGHVQIAGVPDRHEPNLGEVNYAHLFDVIDATGYAGWIGCEYRPRTITEAGLGWLTPYRCV